MIFGILAMTLISSAALADTGRVVLEMKTSGGMMAPNRSNTFITYVLENGDVMQSVRSPIGHHPDEFKATLSRDVMDKLLNLAEKAKAGKLVDADPEAPRCMDAPGTSYKIFKKDGRAVTFKTRDFCHDFFLQNDSLDAYMLSNVLEGLRSLSNL